MWFAAFVLSLLSIAMAAATPANLTKLIKLCRQTVFASEEPSSAPQLRPFPLLALPPEIRLQIYRYALPQKQTIILAKPSVASCPFPPASSPLSIYLPAVFEKLHYGCPCQTRLTPPFLPLLQTCKLVRNEAQELFYGSNAFVLNIDVSRTLLRIPELLALFEGGFEGSILSMIKDFRIRVGGNVMVDVCGPRSRWKKYGGRVLVARVPSDEITGLLRGEENIGKCVEGVLDEFGSDRVSADLIRRVLDEVFWNWQESA
ncbi:uncharacterized protein M437DRAFT_39588 [Aureobasidium melanogenum CBS 110374]|uniref:DUF7730 domain-containing protein n=1 Tax=Aureobasidium melanogenum (strain CBS 110374) TaxID=1043003 RepID=A0A074W3Z3_AURM1|nr:uncharacterized protein M437DRAFT_39588 [Aureobasidium melanogenum CBS 110374]KEQ66254.1 hypothetical protein M437DRAFT_39588 [Aureobasidium melanogenum CBS 110374]